MRTPYKVLSSAVMERKRVVYGRLRDSRQDALDLPVRGRVKLANDANGPATLLSTTAEAKSADAGDSDGKWWTRIAEYIGELLRKLPVGFKSSAKNGGPPS